MSDLRSRLICGGKVRSSRHLSRFGAPSIGSNFVIVRTRLYAALLDILSGTLKQTEAAVLYLIGIRGLVQWSVTLRSQRYRPPSTCVHRRPSSSRSVVTRSPLAVCFRSF